MVREKITRRERLKQRISGDITQNLQYTDIMSVFKNIGNGEAIGKDLYKALVYADAIYGPEYVINLSKGFVTHPEKHDFKFEPVMGNIYAIKFLNILYNFTEDVEYLYAINKYRTNPNKKISTFAYQALEITGRELKPGREELNVAREKINDIVEMIKASSRLQELKGGNE